MPPDNINYMVQRPCLVSSAHGITRHYIRFGILTLAPDLYGERIFENNVKFDNYRQSKSILEPENQNMSKLDWFFISFFTGLDIILSNAELTRCSEKSY